MTLWHKVLVEMDGTPAQILVVTDGTLAHILTSNGWHSGTCF